MITTDQCKFDKNTSTMFIDAMHLGDIFPRQIEIESVHTGRIVKFERIKPGHPRFDEDGWDGEMALYEPCEPYTKVKILIASFSS